MGVFFVTAMEPVQAAGAAYVSGESGYGELDVYTSSPAGEPALFRKTAGNGLASPRTGLQRIFSSCGAHGGASAVCRFYAGTVLNTGYTDVKKTILLKLRI
jgi:hypothetical protein